MLKHKFHSLDQSIRPKGFLDVLKWKLTSKAPVWPDSVLVDKYDIPPSIIEGEKIRVSFIGHVTFLIQTAGLNILTDPVYSLRASPFQFAGPKRVISPGIKFEQLPKIDIILISHNHYDHLDIPTLKIMCANNQPLIVTPLENDKI